MPLRVQSSEAAYAQRHFEGAFLPSAKSLHLHCLRCRRREYDCRDAGGSATQGTVAEVSQTPDWVPVCSGVASIGHPMYHAGCLYLKE